MTILRGSVKTLAGVALAVGFATSAHAQPPAVTVEGAFKQQPRQQGVNVSTPTPDQAAQCKVSPIRDPKDPGKTIGYLVTDANNNPLRQFVSYDNKNFNIVAFYLDGVEAYRETYPPTANEPNQFRWVGPNGSKWGLDHNHDNIVDEWFVISPEEASQELLRAVMTRDPKRFEALVLSPANLKALGLPAADMDKLKARTAGATKRVMDAAETLKLSDKAKWSHVEFGVPQTRPADSFNGQVDYTAYKNGTILIEDGGKSVFLQTGELVQVGRGWKFVDGPSTGDGAQQAGTLVPPEIKELVDQLNAHDQKVPNPPTFAALTAHSAQRAEILENIVTKIGNKAELKETRVSWTKMLIDSHAAAAEGGKPGNANFTRLQQWKEAAKQANQPALEAYAAFRVLVAENSIALANVKDDKELGPVQEKWRAALEDYVKAFPNSADTPEAVWRLAMAWELSGAKESEAKAKQWFDHLVKNYSTHLHAAKASGALKRLDCEGKPLELSGPLLSNPTQQFNAAQKDKVVVVYYWASWSESLAEDAKKLQALEKTYGPKGLAIVTVGLDHDAKTASEAVARVSLPGTHLFTPGGLDNSALAAVYGVLAPPHLFVAGKDGKIVNRNAPLAGLEEELKKLTEK